MSQPLAIHALCRVRICSAVYSSQTHSWVAFKLLTMCRSSSAPVCLRLLMAAVLLSPVVDRCALGLERAPRITVGQAPGQARPHVPTRSRVHGGIVRTDNVAIGHVEDLRIGQSVRVGLTLGVGVELHG